MAIEDYTIMIAIYGAILSTILFIWKIYTYYLQNMSRLKIEPSYGYIAGGISTQESVMVNVANIGKKPVTISIGGFKFEKSKGPTVMLLGSELPKRLEEGESHILYGNIDNFKDELKGLSQSYQIPLYAWVKDQTGKEYTSKINKKSMLYKVLEQ